MSDPVRDAIHAWIREDVPLAGKMNLMPKHVDALIKKLAAHTPQRDEAAAMRQVAANLCATEAGLCVSDIVVGDEIGARLAHARASALLTAAEDIRALPLPPPTDFTTEAQKGEP